MQQQSSYPTSLSFKQLLQDPRLLFAFGFGSGLSPYAPGTAGSLVALLLYPLFIHFPWPGYYICLWLFLCIAAIYSADIAEKKTGVHDNPHIVCDEMVGFWIAAFHLPFHYKYLLSAFILFRLFDILKPWPIYLFQKLPGGFGCVLDDVAAGIMTSGILHLWITIENSP